MAICYTVLQHDSFSLTKFVKINASQFALFHYWCHQISLVLPNETFFYQKSGIRIRAKSVTLLQNGIRVLILLPWTAFQTKGVFTSTMGVSRVVPGRYSSHVLATQSGDCIIHSLKCSNELHQCSRTLLVCPTLLCRPSSLIQLPPAHPVSPGDRQKIQLLQCQL